MPSGGGVGTKCKEIEAIHEKKSVIKIVNDFNFKASLPDSNILAYFCLNIRLKNRITISEVAKALRNILSMMKRLRIIC